MRLPATRFSTARTMFGRAEELAVGFQREQEPQRVGHDQHHREAGAQRMRELRRGRAGLRLGDHRRHQDRDGCEKEQAGLQARAVAVELLHMGIPNVGVLRAQVG